MAEGRGIDEILGAVPPAQALLAGMELGLFTVIDEKALTSAEVAAELGVDASRIARLLYALAMIGILKAENGRFRNGDEALAKLVAGKPGYMGGSHQLLSELWAADLLTAQSIRSARPMAAHDYSAVDEDATARFFRGLAASALAFGRTLGKTEDFATVNSVADIGGGPGSACLGLRESWPHLACTVVELPISAPVSSRLLAEQGATGVEVVEGDIVAGPLSRRYDAAVLKAMIQVLSEDEASAAIRNVAASLNPDGRIYISGSGILEDDRLGPTDAVLVNLTFLNLYREGASYTESEYRAWLERAGFTNFQRSRLVNGSNLISARLA
jgi:SAM-dependent methyltransferase